MTQHDTQDPSIHLAAATTVAPPLDRGQNLSRRVSIAGFQEQARDRADEGLHVYLAAIGVFFTLLGIYLLTHGGEFFVSDGVVMLRTTEAIVERHAIALEPDPGLTQIVPGQDGRYFSKYGLGQPLAAIVPFVIARWLHPIFFEYMYYKGVEGYFVSLFNQFVTPFTGALIVLLAYRLGNGLRLSLALALAWGLATLAWPYSKTFFSEPLFTACLVLAAIGLLAYHQAAGRRRFLWIAVAGFALGYAVLTRASGALLLPAFLAYAMWATTCRNGGVLRLEDGFPVGSRLRWPRVRTRETARAALAFGIPLATCLGLVLWHNAVRFGSPLNNGYGDESFSTPLPIGLAGLLISPGKSIFLYVPLVVLAVLGWRDFWREQRATAALYLAIIVIVVLQTAFWWAWWGGWSWGPRFIVPLLPFLIVSLGPILRRSHAARVASWPLAVAGMLVALLGVLVNFNPYLADLMQRYPGDRPGTEDPVIYFDPALSPIIAHARFLLRGEHLYVATFDLERFGFSARSALLFPALAVAVLLAGIVCIAWSCYRYGREHSRATAA